MNDQRKFWKLASTNIAGENMLLSKHPDQYLGFKNWPTYFSKTKGIEVWDLNKKKYLDFSIMGVGTNSLGYSNKYIDDEVIKTIKKGNLSTFNCYEEVQLSEKLLNINKWANKVRFTRSGGEANAVAIRLARAATGKSKIAVCGYHGWHDWYLAANHNDKKNLDNLILPDLKINGVPKELINTVFPFKFNDIASLKKIINNHNLAAIKIEVEKFKEPSLEFLKYIRFISERKNIVLIFDECTSGFRETFGGIYLKHKINPDVVIYGKALGNGYAINAIVGKSQIMDSIKNTFISSTFWTERIGNVAALNTLKLMKQEQSWKKISLLGDYFKDNFKLIADIYGIKIKISGLKPLLNIEFLDFKNQLVRTYLMERFLKNGILFNTLIFFSTEHKKSKINIYLDLLNKELSILKSMDNNDLIKLLKNKHLSNETFKRINN